MSSAQASRCKHCEVCGSSTLRSRASLTMRGVELFREGYLSWIEAHLIKLGNFTRLLTWMGRPVEAGMPGSSTNADEAERANSTGADVPLSAR